MEHDAGPTIELHQDAPRGFDVRAEDVAWLSPLGFDHVNMLGRYAFIPSDQIARGELSELPVPLLPDPQAQPVSGLSVLLDRKLQSDLSCTRHAEFAAALAALSLPEDAADSSAMNLQ